MPKPGEIFEQRYKLLEIVGAGGIGTVFKARQIDADRTLALKILHKETASDENFNARFMREAQALSKLSHAHIVTVYHLGISENGTPYLAMELIQGTSLRQLLVNGPIPLKRALEITRQVCNALIFVHEGGIVHRDLKPDNLVLVSSSSDQDFVKIIDFGLARFEEQENKQHLTSTGTVVGSVEYMSPEQCRGLKCDARADLYALTVCLYEMITGHTPYVADSPVVLMYKHVHESVPHLAGQNSRSYRVLDEFIQKGLSKDFNARFQTAREMETALNLLIDLSESDESVSPESKRIFWALAGTISLVVLGMAISYFVHSGKANKPEAAALKQMKPRSFHNSEDGLRDLLKRNDLSDYHKVQILIRYLDHNNDAKDQEFSRRAYELVKRLPPARRESLIHKVEYILSLALQQAGKRKEAIEIFEKLMKIDPKESEKYGIKTDDFWTSKGYLAMTYLAEKRVPEAKKIAYEIAARPISGDAEALQVAFLTDDKTLARLLIQNQETCGQLVTSARICRRQKKYEFCKLALERAADEPMTEKEFIELNLEKALYLLQTKNIAGAKKCMLEIFQAPALSDYLSATYRGKYCYEIVLGLEMVACSKEAYELAMKSKFTEPNMLLLKAHLLAERGKYAEARTYLNSEMMVYDGKKNKRVPAVEKLKELETTGTKAGLLDLQNMDIIL